VSLILDAGALVAIERGDREIQALLKGELVARCVPATHGGVVGQVWRTGGPRQARLARLLAGVRVEALDDQLGRRAGALLARTRRSGVIDAALVLLASDGDSILTSDPGDLEPLAAAAGVHVDIVCV
jgi:PIN domain nuclease of toxin-antitoxin system